LSAHFAMLVPVPSAVPAGQGDGPEPESEALAARVAAGPGLWDDKDWLAELRRDGLIGELLASGAIGQAASEGGHGHRLERALTAEMTMLCLVAGALFPGQGYDMVLARAFAMPGTRVRPGTPVPTGPAFSQGRARLGEQPMRRAFEVIITPSRRQAGWFSMRPRRPLSGSGRPGVRSSRSSDAGS
jgi:hypothetical protein